MANEITSSAPDSVQCPVCFKDFKATTINGHLDVCLLKSVTDSNPSTTPGSEPPVKKSRISAETAPPAPTVNTTEVGSSTMAGTPSSAVFSLFHPGKSKVSVPSERSGLSSCKQTSVGAAVSKGIKRCLPSEPEPGLSGTESQVSGPIRQTLRASHGLSPRTLLTIDKPLAEILRPNTLEEYFGQNKIVGQQTLFRSLLDSQEIPSLILWGPPGCGKVGQWCGIVCLTFISSDVSSNYIHDKSVKCII